MALLYRTKDGSLPSRKPKVFFTCHPMDRETYFLPVCEELFHFCNCAVYYDDPSNPSPRDAEYDTNLRQMQLMVIPVTTAFLSQPNDAPDQDFRFAIANHIPVLPLVQEPGLDKLFAKKCGNLQYLDKTVRSATAIPYEEKLAQFLKSVLLNDETIGKIRTHFDGHVFLSYRKKDRRYIHELMKLIHSFPQFRDIGLWYDEYLTPGEDFNDEIETHLNDSKLFALIVTPNLVNEKNYVQEHEYPQAVDRNKPIVAIQYESTDSGALRRDYPDIPDCLDPDDAAGVESALDETLSGISRRENDDDPEHWYHIGLAYLTGTDVEVNHDLAVQLITAAAEAGLEEAMEKLAHMYRDGYGVRRDPDRVIYWVEKFISLSQARYERLRTRTHAELLCAQLGIAASICASVDRYDLSVGYAKQRIDLEKPLYEAGRMDHAKLLTSYEMLAHCYSIQGYENEAFGQLYAAYLLLHDVLKKAGSATVDQLIAFSRLCQSNGDLAKDLQQLTDAEKFYRQAITLLGKPDNAELGLPNRIRMAELHQNLGAVFLLQENFDAAEKEYLTGLEIAQTIASESGDNHILISHYQSLGSLEDHRPGLGSGRKYLKKALEIARARDSRKRTDQTQIDLAECCVMLGFSYYTNWALRLRNVIRGQARPLLEEGLAIFRELDKKQDTYTSRLRVHHALLGLTELHVNMDFFREAEPYCQEQLAISEALLEQMNDPDSVLQLAYDLALMTRICKELKKPVTAAKCARRRFDLLDSIAEDVNTSEVWNALAEASFDWALLTGNRKKLDLAIELWHTLAQEHPEIPTFAQHEEEARKYIP